MLKTGIIGCGGIANAHAKVLSSLDQIDLVGFCDIVQERAEQFNQTYANGGGSVYSDSIKLYEKESLDVVYVCLPPFAHTNEVEQAAKRGIHIFIEKPICLDMETAHRMVEAVEQYGIQSQVGFLMRFGDAVQQTKAMLDSGAAGKPGLMIARYFCNSLHSPWWRDRSKSGGQVVEQIVHIFDLARCLFGEVRSVFCQMDNLFHRDVADYTVEDVSATVLHFANGALGTVSGTNAAIPGRWISAYELVMGQATIYFDDANHATVYHTGSNHTYTTTIASDKDTMLAETQDLIDAIVRNGTTRIPMSEGAKTLELVLAVNESAQTGKPIEL